MARAKKSVRDVQFPLRLPPQVYQRVREDAEKKGDSINTVLARLITREYAVKSEQSGNRTPALTGA